MSPTPRDLFDAANDWDDRRGAPGFDDVGRVIAIVASSRGGSSLLYELLSTRSGAISIGGEHTALYKRNGLTRGANGSDVLPDDVPFDRDRLSRDFAALLGVHEQPLRRPPTDELVGSFIRRLALQWPHACLDPHHIESAVHDSMSASASTESAFRATIATLRTRGCPVNPVFYDGSDTKRPPGHVPPFDAPGVEEPPFVLPTGRRAPSTDEARSGVLVLKSSVDAYRLPLLRRMFPTADVRVLHLTRNPAASVNGLYDGWRDRGFFSYDVSAESPLSIAGYSELGEFATRWWNFDIPPRWRDVARSPLEVVAAEQWSAAHSSVLDGLGSAGADAVLRMRFEEVANPATRLRALDEIYDFAGFDDEAETELPTVMATSRPRPGRWLDRAELIRSAVDTLRVRRVAQTLGYDYWDQEAWI